MSEENQKRPPLGIRVQAHSTVYSGYLKVDRYKLSHEHYQGGWSKVLDREVMHRKEISAVLPYDPVRGEILLVEQFRVGALEWRDTPWCLELIAGIADKDGESAADLIRREAVEEAGLTLGTMEPIAAYMPSPGGTNERLQVFVGHADLAGAGGIFGCPDEGEDIRAVTVSANDIPALLESGKVDNAASLIALQWLLLNRDRLDASWGGQ